MIAEDNKVKLKMAAVHLQCEIKDLCSDGFEKSMALAKVEEALFWSEKCIISGEDWICGECGKELFRRQLFCSIDCWARHEVKLKE